MNDGSKIIQYFGQPMRVNCDRNCGKAWGICERPRIQPSDDEDDYYWLADQELGVAPDDPGTYEGGHAKPMTPRAFPNKWCVRQCERCIRDDDELLDFTKRIYNIKPHYRDEGE